MSWAQIVVDAAAMLGLTLKQMTEQAVTDFIAKNNIAIPVQPDERPAVTN